ncbi:MAG: hypothetical protein M1820_001222 [Bogoriella megaspora]|nr:MAG: hypothetical protein M1820_001222 [Bogoriella megaspora]
MSTSVSPSTSDPPSQKSGQSQEAHKTASYLEPIKFNQNTVAGEANSVPPNSSSKQYTSDPHAESSTVNQRSLYSADARPEHLSRIDDPPTESPSPGNPLSWNHLTRCKPQPRNAIFRDPQVADILSKDFGRFNSQVGYNAKTSFEHSYFQHPTENRRCSVPLWELGGPSVDWKGKGKDQMCQSSFPDRDPAASDYFHPEAPYHEKRKSSLTRPPSNGAEVVEFHKELTSRLNHSLSRRSRFENRSPFSTSPVTANSPTRSPCDAYLRKDSKNPEALKKYFNETSAITIRLGRRHTFSDTSEEVVSAVRHEVEQTLPTLKFVRRGKGRVVDNHWPSSHSREIGQQGEGSSAAKGQVVSRRPKFEDLRGNGMHDSGASKPMLVPYGQASNPFGYDSRREPRRFTRPQIIGPSNHGFQGKNFTSKGVPTAGALGVPFEQKPRKRGSGPELGIGSHQQQRSSNDKHSQRLSNSSAKDSGSDSDVNVRNCKGKNPQLARQSSGRLSAPMRLLERLRGRPTKTHQSSGKPCCEAARPASPYPNPLPLEHQANLGDRKSLEMLLPSVQAPDSTGIPEEPQLNSPVVDKVRAPKDTHPALRNVKASVAEEIEMRERKRRPGQESEARLTNNLHNEGNDESLRKWKESLGLGTGESISDPSDPRKAIILSLGLEVEGRPDIIIDLTTPGALDALKNKPFTIKEGANFRMKAKFKVQHQILSGLKYVQNVKRGPVGNKMQEMIGSYSPNTKDKPFHEKKFEPETAPSGMLGRGHYKAVSSFVDDDNVTHLKFEWSFDVKKDW